MFRVCHPFLSVHCSLMVTCLVRANLLAFSYVMFSCVFVTFSCAVLGQVWYLIVSIPDLCLLTFIREMSLSLRWQRKELTLLCLLILCLHRRNVIVYLAVTNAYTGNTRYCYVWLTLRLYRSNAFVYWAVINAYTGNN